MVALALRTSSRYNDILTRGVQSRAQTLLREMHSIQRAAAAKAQGVSLENIRQTRPSAPARRGRDEPSISSVLRWRPVSVNGDTTGVGLNLTDLNDRVKHWIIQEVGTGESAVVRVAGRANPVGRPAAGATYVRTVPSQRGRRISSSLVWATGPNGKWTRPGEGHNQQLFLRSKVKGVPSTSTRSQPGIIIQREIEPRHFVQRGGQEGFRLYRGSVLTAARQQFRRPR